MLGAPCSACCGCFGGLLPPKITLDVTVYPYRIGGNLTGITPTEPTVRYQSQQDTSACVPVKSTTMNLLVTSFGTSLSYYNGALCNQSQPCGVVFLAGGTRISAFANCQWLLTAAAYKRAEWLKPGYIWDCVSDQFEYTASYYVHTFGFRWPISSRLPDVGENSDAIQTETPDIAYPGDEPPFPLVTWSYGRTLKVDFRVMLEY
jgi:hypothetical protein